MAIVSSDGVLVFDSNGTPEAAAAVLAELAGRPAPIQEPRSLTHKAWVEMALQNARLAILARNQATAQRHVLNGAGQFTGRAAQAFLKGSAQAALLFDEVEDVFPPLSMEASQFMARAEQTMGRASQSVSGKAWVNQILETNPVPTLWVTNRIEQIDPAFRRRFAYHLELNSPPPGAREQLVHKALAGQPVTQALVASLSARQELTPAQIHTAVRFAALAQTEGEPLDALIERQLAHADHALGRAPAAAASVSTRTHISRSTIILSSSERVSASVTSRACSGWTTASP